MMLLLMYITHIMISASKPKYFGCNKELFLMINGDSMATLIELETKVHEC